MAKHQEGKILSIGKGLEERAREAKDPRQRLELLQKAQRTHATVGDTQLEQRASRVISELEGELKMARRERLSEAEILEVREHAKKAQRYLELKTPDFDGAVIEYEEARHILANASDFSGARVIEERIAGVYLAKGDWLAIRLELGAAEHSYSIAADTFTDLGLTKKANEARRRMRDRPDPAS